MNFKEFKAKYQYKEVVEYPNNVPTNVVVSVCVQTYQHAHYIEECLDSILEQKTDFDFEILVGEDDSNDNTRKICIEYALKYPNKIRLFLHSRENNIKIKEVPTGRFNAFYNYFSSNGKYIAICEGDDYWTDATKLQRQVSAMEKNPDINICGHPSSKLNDKNNTIIGTAGFHGSIEKIILPHAIISNRGAIAPMQSLMIKNRPLGDLFDLAIDSIGLHGIIIIYMSIPNGYLYLPDKMSIYRVNASSSIMANSILNEDTYLKNNLSKIKVLERLDLYYDREYSNSFQKKIDEIYYLLLKSKHTKVKTKFKYVKLNFPSLKNLFIGSLKRLTYDIRG